jgi:hypothetical protein
VSAPKPFWTRCRDADKRMSVVVGGPSCRSARPPISDSTPEQCRCHWPKVERQKLRSRTRSCSVFDGLATTAPDSASLDETRGDLGVGAWRASPLKTGLFAGSLCAYVLFHDNASKA